MRVGDIEVLLIRDAQDRAQRPKLVLRLSMRFTEEKHFYIPEMWFDPCLMLSPHTYLLAIFFRHRAFRSRCLNDKPDALITMNLNPKGDEFRNAINYSLRYGQGNKLDRDRNISDVVRNLVLNHAPSSGTFQGHYLNRNVGIDVQALHRGIEAQQSLIQQDTSHGHSRDARRPVAFPDGQMERALAKSRNNAGGSRTRGSALRYQIRQDELKRVREEWDSAQAVEDIERQIAGGEVSGPPEEPTATRGARPMSKLLFIGTARSSVDSVRLVSLYAPS
ncbi:hypothetical protein F5883DRAFT_635073 [Diaporthe sp. PMI_573]|nr:hypothetical protein F5883DRAFT_635073 [Diaporthaceae sp. PMI_573]